MDVSIPPEIVDDPLALDSNDRELYLVKVPASLGAVWKSIQESECKVGTISLGQRDAKGKRKGVLSLEENMHDKTLPKEYRMDFQSAGYTAQVFSQDGSGRMAIEGNVVDTGVIMPIRNTEYSTFCKQRLLKHMVKERYVKPIEDLPRAPATKAQFTIDAPKVKEEEDDDDGMDVSGHHGGGSSSKNTKMSKEELKNVIFHHFEERDFWALKELNSHVHQPEGFLKEMLKEICIYHRKGLNKSCYELKPQYKHAVKGDIAHDNGKK